MKQGFDKGMKTSMTLLGFKKEFGAVDLDIVL